MTLDREYLEGLARLHKTGSSDERRAIWRQNMATLAAEAAEQRPVPLEGLAPEQLLLSTRVAIANGRIGTMNALSMSPPVSRPRSAALKAPEVLRLWGEGVTNISEIARQTGIGRASVRRILAKESAR